MDTVDFDRDDSFRSVLGLIRNFHAMEEPAETPSARCKTSLASIYGLMSETSTAFHEVSADFERLILSGSRALEFLANQGCTALGNLVLSRQDSLLADVRSTVPAEEVARLRYSPLPETVALLLDSALTKMRAAANDALVQWTLHPPRIPQKPAAAGGSAGSSASGSGQAGSSGARPAQKQTSSSSPSGQSGKKRKNCKGKAPFSSSSGGSGRSGGKGKGAGKKLT